MTRWPLCPGSLCVVAAHLFALTAHAAEICRFAGTTDYDGQVAVTSSASNRASDGAIMVDVIARFDGTPMPLVHINYLSEEISTWQSGRLLSLAVNNRTIVDGHIVRQQWDVFDRGSNGLDASRLQGKEPDDFRRQHPGFVGHWDPDTFGQPWLQDYPAGSPERRSDLDLPNASGQSDLRSPLALAFYWTRRLPRSGQAITVVLPGFKRNKSVDLTISGAGPSGDGGRLWQTSVRHPAFRTSRPSSAQAWVSPDGHLVQLAFTVQSRSRTANGVIRQVGCSDIPATPGGPER